MEKSTKYVIAIDVGGTNTDCVLKDIQTNEIKQYKKAFTTPDVTTGIYNSIKHCLDSYQGLDKKQIISCVIGTTHFINAILQKSTKTPFDKLNKVAVIRLCGPTSYDFTPFCSIENPQLLERIQGPYFLLDGGFYFTGQKEYTRFRKEQIIDCARRIYNDNIHYIAIISTYSMKNKAQEELAQQILHEEIKKLDPEYFLSSTISFDLCKKEGLLERENATIINECLKDLAQQTFHSYSLALKELGLENVPLFISHNDGSIIDCQEAMKFPIFTFSASVVNSLKGGACIYNKKDAIIVDVGGTSTDVAVISKGIPITASKYTVISGIPLNFRTPLVHSIALGGGSIVEIFRDKDTNQPIVKLRDESIAFRLLQDSVCFGGEILCNNDFAISQNENYEKEIGGKKEYFINYLTKKSFSYEEINTIIIPQHKKLVSNKLLREVETLITDGKQNVDLLFVGGGQIILDMEFIKQQCGFQCEFYFGKNFAQVANALGASLAEKTQYKESHIEVGGENAEKEEQQIKKIQEELEQEMLEKGCEQPIEVVEIITYKLPYLEQKHMKNLYIKLKGCFSWLNMYNKGRLVKNHGLNENLININDKQKSQQKNQQKNYENVIFFKTPNQPVYQNNLVPDYVIPVLTLKDNIDIEKLAWGCSILGSGGGGSVEKSAMLIKMIQQKQNNRPFHIYDPFSLKNDDIICGVAHFGAPSVFQEFNYTIAEIYSSYQSLNQYMGNVFKGISCLELGGCNGLSPVIASISSGLPLFDLNYMCRAFPEYKMTLPSIHGDLGLPISFGDSKHNRFTIENLYKEGDEYSIEEANYLEALMRDWVVQHFGLMGNIGCLAFNKTKFENLGFFKGYQLAYQIGDILYKEINEQQKPVEEVIQNGLKVVDEKVKLLIKGKIIQVKRNTYKGYDFGQIIIKQAADESENGIERRMLIAYKNEYLLAYELKKDEQGEFSIQEVAVMTPDIITIIDDFKGYVIHSEDACYGLRVIAFAMRSDDKFKTERSLKYVGPQAMGIGVDFEYKPYY